MGSQHFRLAIVGTGMAAETLHLPAALASDRVEVVALVDPAVERASGLALRWGLRPEVAACIEDVRAPIDGAIIASPNDTHCAVALACCARGVHCLIEKPLATTVADAEAVCLAGKKHQVVVGVGYATRFRNEVVLLKQLLDNQYFGAIHRFYFQDGTTGGWSPVSAYNLDRKASGGGVLMVVGTHFLDRMLYWFGYPDECEMADDADDGIEAQCLVNVRYRSRGRRIDGAIRLSKVSTLPPGLVIDTERGRVLLGLGTSPLLFRPHSDPDLQFVLQSRGEPRFAAGVNNFQLQLEDFVAACRERRPPLADGEQGLLSVRLIERLYSAKKRLNEPRFEDEPVLRSCRSKAQSRAPDMQVAVFGASGFVGSTLVERLRRSGVAVVPIIHTTGGAWRLARGSLALRSVDVTSPTAVAEALRGCTHVVNCIRGSGEAMIKGLNNLLSAARRQGIRRFVHLSSVAVYGDPPPPESASEDAAARPEPGSYGALKLHQDRLVERAHNSGLSCAILCPPNITGIYSSFVVNVVEDIRLGRLALVDGGELPINVVDVENLCHAIMLALAADSTDGQRIFVTDDGDISWRAFIEELSPLAERATPLPALSRKELAVQTTTSVRRSFTRTLKHIGSSEVRAALRRDPILDGAEQMVRDLVNRLPQRIQDRMRLGLNGSPQVQKVITECVPASRYNAQQLRGVVHSCARARRALEYSSIISFTESMARFRNWYRATRGMDLDSWDLARDLLPSE